MAHYVAEQITIAENATGDEKSKAEKRCFETTLKLWQHRSSLPAGRRPLESFEPVFRALDRLDPDNPRPFFYSPLQSNPSESGDATEVIQEDVREWTEIALGIDRAARVLINFALNQAALNAADEKTSSWLKNATNLTDSDDLSVVVRLLPPDVDDKDEEILEQIRQGEEKDIRSKIDKLDAFIELSGSLRMVLANELEKVSKEDTGKDEINDSK
jgi:hypothetical protein